MLACSEWHETVEKVSIIRGSKNELWRHRIEPRNCKIWSKLVENIPLDLKTFIYSKKLHRGIRDKTGEFIERRKTYSQHWHRECVGGNFLHFTSHTTSTHMTYSKSSAYYRFFYRKIQQKSTNGFCIKKKDCQKAIFNFKTFFEIQNGKSEFNFIQSNSLFFTWDVDGTNKSSMNFEKYSVKIWDFKKQRNPIFVVDPPLSVVQNNQEIGIKVGTSISGRYFFVFYHHPQVEVSRTLRSGISIRLFVVENDSRNFSEVPLLDPKEMKKIFENSRVEISWKEEDFLLIQTPYSRENWLISCKQVCQNRHPRVYLNESEIGFSDVFKFQNKMSILFDCSTENDQKMGKLVTFPIEEDPRISLSASSVPKFKISELDLIWKETTNQFFLPFRIESNCLLFARYQGALLPNEEIPEVAENKNVHLIPLYQLFENHRRNKKTLPIEFNPKATKIVGIYPKGSRLDSTENRVTSVEKEKVFWLKSAEWDYFLPAQRSLWDKVGYNPNKRKIQNSQNSQNSKRIKLHL